jgi:OLD-like protein
MNAVVLVEGTSDRVALETLARRRGRDLEAEGVEIVAIGGAHAIGAFLEQFRDVRVAGLCDAGEQGVFARALERAGYGSALSRGDLARLGFHICVADLEDELIRALGAERVEELFAEHGDLHSFRTFQRQPEWRGRPVERQMRRLLGSSVGKIKYARIFVEALELERMPAPLDAVLADVR